MAEKRAAQIAGHLNYPKGMLAGQVAIITGSGQGIGAEAARLFANEGAKVVVQDIDAREHSPYTQSLLIEQCPLTIIPPYTEKAEAVAKAINESGGSAVAIPGDMLDSAYIDTLVKKAAEFGNGKIHIIVNNAGFTWDGVIHKVRLVSTRETPITVQGPYKYVN